jgi:deoxyribonuclease-4
LARIVGIAHVKAFHLNDSVKELGSRVDRHAHIGRGKIGRGPFRLLVNDARFAKLPMILETPKVDEMDMVNLRLLRRMTRAKR